MLMRLKHCLAPFGSTIFYRNLTTFQSLANIWRYFNIILVVHDSTWPYSAVLNYYWNQKINVNWTVHASLSWVTDGSGRSKTSIKEGDEVLSRFFRLIDQKEKKHNTCAVAELLVINRYINDSWRLHYWQDWLTIAIYMTCENLSQHDRQLFLAAISQLFTKASNSVVGTFTMVWRQIHCALTWPYRSRHPISRQSKVWLWLAVTSPDRCRFVRTGDVILIGP